MLQETSLVARRAVLELPYSPATAEEVAAKRLLWKKARRTLAPEYHKTGQRRAMLRVKVKSLMEEARIIRAEEHRTRNGWLFAELREHRVKVLRCEARATHIAYGLLRGKTLGQIEFGLGVEKPMGKYIADKVLAMLGKYKDDDQNIIVRTEKYFGTPITWPTRVERNPPPAAVDLAA